MDDFTLATLQDSRNEWSMQLINILTPLVIEGFNSIFQESWKLCETNDEEEKYLMTFQNFIARIPKWNQEVIHKERQRILQRSACGYLEDLLTCVHVIQLKLLTCIRVSKNQKKIDINIPKMDDFIHKLYILVARKLYSNVYLYDRNTSPLQKQKHNREFEVIVQECILNSIRESMPVEQILRAYLDETIEEDVEETIKEEEVDVVDDEVSKTESKVADTPEKESEKSYEVDTSASVETEPVPQAQSISFDDTDYVKDSNNIEHEITAPKTIEKLEEISKIRNGAPSNFDNEDDEGLLVIDDASVNDVLIDVENIDAPGKQDPPVLSDIQILV